MWSVIPKGSVRHLWDLSYLWGPSYRSPHWSHAGSVWITTSQFNLALPYTGGSQVWAAGAARVSPGLGAWMKLHWLNSFRCFRTPLSQNCSFRTLHKASGTSPIAVIKNTCPHPLLLSYVDGNPADLAKFEWYLSPLGWLDQKWPCVYPKVPFFTWSHQAPPLNESLIDLMYPPQIPRHLRKMVIWAVISGLLP